MAFRVRAEAGTGKKRMLRVSGETFIERFMLHVFPRGFKRIRHYGLLAPAHKVVRLTQARAALAVPPPNPVVIESVAEFMQRVSRLEWCVCPQCRTGRFVVSAALPPSGRSGVSSRGPP